MGYDGGNWGSGRKDPGSLGGRRGTKRGMERNRDCKSVEGGCIRQHWGKGREEKERGEERRKTGMGGKRGAPQDGRGEAYLLLRRLTRPQPLTPSRGNKILPLKAHLVSSHPRSARYWAPPPLTSSPESQPSLADVVLQARKPHGHVQLPENHTCDSENSWRMWLCENLAKVQVRGAESMQCYSALK